MRRIWWIWVLFVFGTLALAQFGTLALAQDVTPPDAPIDEVTGYLEGRIIALDAETDQATVEVDGSPINALLGTLEIDAQGEMPGFQVGDRVELYYAPNPEGIREYVVIDWVRRPALAWLAALFLAVSVAVARLKGLRAFVATGCSLLIVMWFIIPQILQGQNPVWVSLVGVGGMLILAIYFVHGLSWSTTAALLGTFAAVLFTMALGLLFSERRSA